MCDRITGLGSQAGSRSAVLKLNCVQGVPSPDYPYSGY